MTSLVIHSRPSLACAVELLQRAGLPTTDLTDAHLAHFFYCGPESTPSGLIGLELHGSDALLRSLVVAPELRSSGLGGALVEHAEVYASGAGVRSIYLLTTTAEPFFRRRGYALADRLSAPALVQRTDEFASICPASSAFMVKHLAS